MDAVSNLLEQIEKLQSEKLALQNKLRIYENF
jgi:hypothetical protein